MPVRRKDGAPLPVGPLVHHRLARLGAHPSVLEHRRQVDVEHVAVPVDGCRVEAERRVIVVVAGARQLEQVVDPVARVGLRVGAVELHVAQGPFGHGVAVLDTGGQLRLPASDRQGSDQLLGEIHGRVGAAELSLHAPAPGEGPLGHADGLAPVVVEGVALEEAGGELDQAAVAQRVPHAGGDVVHLRPPRLGPAGGDGQDGGHHQVDRDDVDDALGHAGELAQQPAGVGDDDRLRHAEAPDPARDAARPAPTQ